MGQEEGHAGVEERFRPVKLRLFKETDIPDPLKHFWNIEFKVGSRILWIRFGKWTDIDGTHGQHTFKDRRGVKIWMYRCASS